MKRNNIYQDNTLSILLEVNGKKSSGKRTRHINIQCFLITDAVDKKEVKIVWIPREGMYTDFMTKAQSGVQFCRMWNYSMGAKSIKDPRENNTGGMSYGGQVLGQVSLIRLLEHHVQPRSVLGFYGRCKGLR